MLFCYRSFPSYKQKGKQTNQYCQFLGKAARIIKVDINLKFRPTSGITLIVWSLGRSSSFRNQLPISTVPYSLTILHTMSDPTWTTKVLWFIAEKTFLIGAISWMCYVVSKPRFIGVSLRSQLIFAIVYVSEIAQDVLDKNWRHFPLNLVASTVFLLATLWIMYKVYMENKLTNDLQYDVFSYYLLAAFLLLAAIISWNISLKPSIFIGEFGNNVLTIAIMPQFDVVFKSQRRLWNTDIYLLIISFHHMSRMFTAPHVMTVSNAFKIYDIARPVMSFCICAAYTFMVYPKIIVRQEKRAEIRQRNLQALGIRPNNQANNDRDNKALENTESSTNRTTKATETRM